MLKVISLVLGVSFLVGCLNDSDSSDQLPLNEFKAEYTLIDFNLSEDYLYWEVRQGNMLHQEEHEDVVRDQYDEGIYSSLTDVQLEILGSVDSNSGFDYGCAPSYCPYYGAALIDNSIVTIETRADLIAFFGSIDTEAELSVLLSIGYNNAELYEKIEDGYRVIIAWDDLCGTQGKDLIKVYADGTTEKIREISRENYEGCV